MGSEIPLGYRVVAFRLKKLNIPTSNLCCQSSPQKVMFISKGLTHVQMGREIESRQGIHKVVVLKEKKFNTCPTSAMTESVNGMPMMAKRMQKARPGVVTGAMLPYPETSFFSL
jgi:hypothetical protein